MSFFNLLYTVLIKPLQLVFEIIFMIAYRVIGNPALAIIFLSLAMNFLVLPLYRRADAMQEEARDMDNKLRKGISHIKKSFSGDEKMMILQTYYRQNNYSPLSSLKGSVSLLLEIPFFIAAYRLLSSTSLFGGVSFGPISDLSQPDALICIAGISINLLPIVMTLINIISSAMFLKGFPLKSKIQLYGMALFFLVFLYNSPAGLVFYWTLNNIFSLVKTIFYKIPNPRKTLCGLSSAAGICILLLGLVYFGFQRPKFMLVLTAGGIALQFPLFLSLWLKKHPKMPELILSKPEQQLFNRSCLLICIISGLLIPSAVLSASPLEFINPNYFHNPLLFVLMSLCLAAGCFLLWFRIFYGLATSSGKVILARTVFTASLLMLTNYMFFGTDLGTLNSSLQYEQHWSMPFTAKEISLNLVILLIVAAVTWLLSCKKAAWANIVSLILCLTLGGMAAINCFSIHTSVSEFKRSNIAAASEKPELTLSRDGQNVIVLMLDRAYGGYVPYVFNEKPELAEKFDGFTWYANTISFGQSTNVAASALFGGYEYTPEALNSRSDQSLMDKHNEALKLMPELFYNENYDVTVCDVPYANFSTLPDLSIYSSYDGMATHVLTGSFADAESVSLMINRNYRNFFCYSIMKCAPMFLQDILYFNGNYNMDSPILYMHAIENFTKSYSVLAALPEITNISADSAGAFLMLNNETPHEVAVLQLPDYIPSPQLNNTGLQQYSMTVDGDVLQLDDYSQISSYHANMATFLKLAEWFDYLREQGVYDNTRIILVADHGTAFINQESMHFKLDSNTVDVAAFYPLLMVKDFNSTGFVRNYDFMTNADVPTIAIQDVISNPINPFTGNAVSSAAKFSQPQYISAYADHDLSSKTATTFPASPWYSVENNLLVPSNWTYYSENMVLPSVSGN